MPLATSSVLGIDIGSVAVSLVHLTTDRRILETAYALHGGDVKETLHRMLSGFDLNRPVWVAANAAAPETLRAAVRINAHIGWIAGARHVRPEVRAILAVGAETFHLIRLGADGGYRGSRSSSACAAGTGAFLDQQARRLDLAGAAEISRLALRNTDPRPCIATRCAVFAKTDLIHAQQEGYNLEAVCDGLCHGMAKNIADAVLGGGTPPADLLFCGGVARNEAVRRHLEAIAGVRLHVPSHPRLFGALGTGLAFIAAHLAVAQPPRLPTPMKRVTPDDLFRPVSRRKRFVHPPLSLTRSAYPDFHSLESFRHPRDAKSGDAAAVEVDRYHDFGSRQSVYLGVDIGSTSTKAVLTDPDKTVLAGFYTRTTGRPLAALQRLLAAVNDLAARRRSVLIVRGAATTGSGRKFIGNLVAADLILDEITAHARAAWELNPAVDTIIEIGGQDAKFTTLRDGRVTSATMNTVCAAGTGSFIEEQAAKLGCPLDAFSQRTEHRRAPMASDRCTVFMERDLNYFLAAGWDPDEVLASVLHAVRENYLLKVATPGRIGDVISFQGATAKNRALVAAFEQRLKKPVLVSKYCHLTGALGAALMLRDAHRARKDRPPKSTFVGLDLGRFAVPVRSETCDLCANHCKLTVAEVGGRTLAYGFLCGRDYGTRRFVSTDNGAFDLPGEYRRAERFTPGVASSKRPTIGLPAGGHLVEDMPFWKVFFDHLGFSTATSEHFTEAVRVGKPLMDAEFCAPMTALQGHVHHLRARCDYVFLPIYLEDRSRERGVRRQYCYYTQFASALADTAPSSSGAVLSPLVRYLYAGFHTRMELYRMLNAIPGVRVTFREVGQAYEAAHRFQAKSRERLIARWQDHCRSRPTDIRVVLLGRPYTLFSPALNGGIPDLLRRQGIDCCHQDMLATSREDLGPIRPLLAEIHWRHGARVMAAAQRVAAMQGVYPVFVTSFKCSPDAFVRDYFKRLMAAHDKPYLLLELDEHDSSVGYETRIEAAVRAFRNHHHSAPRPARQDYRGVNPDLVRGRTDRVIVLPNWDRLSGRLLEAVLRREGRRAILMAETETTITKSLGDNTGQCIPLNAVVEGFVECLARHGLAPEEAALWMSRACIACNIGLYPHHMKSLLGARGGGLEKADVYVGDMFFKDVSPRASFNAVFAYMFGGLLRRLACRLRPYECHPGDVDRAMATGLHMLAQAFEGRLRKQEALAEVVTLFERISVRKNPGRPKVAVFGDLYSRDNRVMNQDLIRFIERYGGEVVTTPYTEYARMIASPYFRKWFFERKFYTLVSNRALMAAISRLERTYYRMVEPLLGEPMARFDDPPEDVLARYGVRIEHTGESLDNLLKVHYIKKHHPDVTLFVQASPAFCCSSLVTEAMARRIEAVTGVPVVSIVYDGTGGNKNDALVPYLTYPRSTPAASHAPVSRVG